MPMNKKLSQTPPDKANELFEKLLATSDNAIKTRERLFSELKDELELLANLQEQHLFPVLREHRQDLVEEAVDDIEETSSLLSELEQMPKNGSEFIGKVAELRRLFLQHIQDDRNELLPAVLEVLSDEEAEAVAEKVEDEMASLDETKRAGSRRDREQSEAMRRLADGTADPVRVATEGAQAVVRTMQEAVENGLNAVSDLARLSTGQAMEVFNKPESNVQEVTERASQNFLTVAQSSAAMVRSVQNVTRECFELSQKRFQTNLDGLGQLVRCRSLSDFVAVQSSLIRDNLEQTLNNSRRIAELTTQLADEATRTVTADVEKAAESISRAA